MFVFFINAVWQGVCDKVILKSIKAKIYCVNLLTLRILRDSWQRAVCNSIRQQVRPQPKLAALKIKAATSRKPKEGANKWLTEKIKYLKTLIDPLFPTKRRRRENKSKIFSSILPVSVSNTFCRDQWDGRMHRCTLASSSPNCINIWSRAALRSSSSVRQSRMLVILIWNSKLNSV